MEVFNSFFLISEAKNQLSIEFLIRFAMMQASQWKLQIDTQI